MKKKKKRPTNGLGIDGCCALKLINPLLEKAVRTIHKIILFNSVYAPSTEKKVAGYLIHGFADVGFLCLAFSLHFKMKISFLSVILIQEARKEACIGWA